MRFMAHSGRIGVGVRWGGGGGGGGGGGERGATN